MKKLNAYLHNSEVQGVLIVALLFAAVVVTTVLTWGK
jgi:hypothetical protein